MHGAGARNVLQILPCRPFSKEFEGRNELLKRLSDGGELECVAVEIVEDIWVKHHVIEDHVVLLHAWSKLKLRFVKFAVKIDVDAGWE